MRNKITVIDARSEQIKTPVKSPIKTNWKVEVIKKGLGTLQYISPLKTPEIIWHYFTRPARSRFTDSQRALIDQARITYSSYRGHQLVNYTWGEKGPKVLLGHGWQSKVADFRKMITVLVKQGYVVEGIDMKAHGRSEGKHTALPEFRDILKDYYVRQGPYHAIIGYSMGGLAAALVLSEISSTLHPDHLVLLATPPYAKYFFESTVRQLGYNDAVLNEMCALVEKKYGQELDYFNLSDKAHLLQKISIQLIYDEHDLMVPFEKAEQMRGLFPNANFVHGKGLGHNKILSYPEIISQVMSHIGPKKLEIVD